ncbi:MAG: serine peptidase [Labilithrix sp.]|nr:serine peptidase [Labilithrix sp.]
MPIAREIVEKHIFGGPEERRFTQDSPIMPDVWIAFGAATERRDLLFSPHRDSTPARLAEAIRSRLDETATRAADIACNATTVVARLTFEELVTLVLPLSGWWKTHASRNSRDREWLTRVLGLIASAPEVRTRDGALPPRPILEKRGKALIGRARPATKLDAGVLWSVNRNRSARTQLWRSAPAVKADAATRLFNIRCSDLTFAVIDSGIDARHPAFVRRDERGKPLRAGLANSRVTATYDFTRIRSLLDPHSPHHRRLANAKGAKGTAPGDTKELREAILNGRDVDWSLIEKLITVPHDAKYKAPKDDHGTHVAGILGGDWRVSDRGSNLDMDLIGVCPDIRLWDVRVLNDKGEGDEFSIIAALQFLRFKNAHADAMAVQGANMSLSILHDVVNYACGRTPVCEEAERLVDSGVVVVAAAGNEGHIRYVTPSGESDGFAYISITDPGNAEDVLTVGSTHRYRPHSYGVSYFSSRGPTGDGRVKPDLVAPGEKIKSPITDGGVDSKDGTSMAAPHVSGAAALLMARHREVVAEPRRIKQILCATATDLGRERYFQGAGMVDILRALQSV